MQPKANLCEVLAWDSAFFGFGIGRVTVDCFDRTLGLQIRDWALANRIRCVYFLADPDRFEVVHGAVQAGFEPVDIRLTLEAAVPAARTVGASSGPVMIRAATQQDLAVLQRIARNSHRDSRFFFDPRFPAEKSASLYERWLEVDANTAGTVLLLAELEGQPVGYLSCADQNQERARIRIFGVDSAHRGQGLGKALLGAAFESCRRRAVPSIDVITQGRNIAAQRFYQSNGFRTRSIQLWFHRWFNPE